MSPSPATQPPRVERPPIAAGSFERRTEQGRYLLTWGFTDHHGETHALTCSVGLEDHAREQEAFGYDQRAVAAERTERLRDWTKTELLLRGLDGVVRVEIDDGGWRARHQLAATLDRAEAQRLDAEARRFYAFMKTRFPEEWARETDALVRPSGLRYDGKRLGIDYEGLADRAMDPLSGCARALRWAAGRASDRRLLEIVLAFLQEIPYRLPPDTARGRSTLGLYPPTEVLVGNHGDCDSKAVAFAALWRRVEVPLLVIRVPGHVLLGVGVRPGPGERHVRVGNRYFVLCEVAGPGKIRPGHTSVEGSYEYVLLEPVSSR